MGFKSGIQANINSISGVFDKFVAKHDTVIVGRVTDIILNNRHPEYDNYGGDNSIGGIFFEIQNFNSPGSTFAKPFYPQFSSYPLVNELVLIHKLPGENMNKAGSNEVFYYVNMINLWNHPHHNAFPNVGQLNTSPLNQQTYDQTSKGITRQVNSSNPPTINLNSDVNPSQATFQEKGNIHPLLPFAGDVIHQGRWGNSIRFGSTVQNGLPDELNLNNWSDVGTNGDPITLIRNGQPNNSSKQGWTHITENINNDLSSIYLTTSQSIQLFPSSENYRSFNTLPTSVSTFTKPQVIINSDRVVINAKTDSVLLSAQKSVSLSTNESININTKDLFIDSGNIRLGNKNARESVIKGDTLYAHLDQMLKALLQMLAVLRTSVVNIDPSQVTADSEKNIVYANVETSLELIQQNLETIKSKNVKTI